MSALAYDEVLSDVAGQEGSGLLTEDGRSLPARFHPLAQLFPMIEGEAFAALVEDVRVSGVRRPIVLFEGMILDGRNRYLAAREAGVGYLVTDFTGDDPVAFVVSENIHRRHLTESQRALVAAKIAKLPRGANQHAGASADMRTLPTAADAAAQLNVSTRMVESARSVVRDGAPALVTMVEAGTASVSAAAEVAKLPDDLQAEVVAEGPDAVRETAKVIREDATVLERLEAGDPATVAAVREQIREVASAPKPKTSRANPAYDPDPKAKAAINLADCANQIAEAVSAHGPSIMSAMPDAASRARAVAKIERARDALNAILEERHGTR